MLPNAPAPSHRHGAPSGPWPFLDIDDAVDKERIANPESHLLLSAKPCLHRTLPADDFCWCKYPQSLFPNWAQAQQRKSRIQEVIERTTPTTIHYLDIKADGFVDAGDKEVTEPTLDSAWAAISQGRPPGVHVRSVFIEKLSGPAMQMLGTHYGIEPFFFSSSLGWIPSRFQSNIVPRESDHMTITLSFIRAIDAVDVPSASMLWPNPTRPGGAMAQPSNSSALIINTQGPLHLRSTDRLLVPDLLAVHLVRSHHGSTIISYHPGPEHHATAADSLKRRLQLTGQSVYWNSIFATHADPTFVYLSLFWYVLYAWDESMETLYAHICALEAEVIHANDIDMTHELHVIRAHLLHYESLLGDFRKSIQFILKTTNPALANPDYFTPEQRKISEVTLVKECNHIINEIDRLEMNRDMQDKRLKNVMNLGFSMVNIEDSKRMQKLTEAAVRDSAAMKQISYLTMVFLPSTFVATAFGMNITALDDEVKGTIGQYLGISIPLTAITIWVLVAYQIQIRGPADEPPASADAAAAADQGQNASPVSTKPVPKSKLRLFFPKVRDYAYYGPGFQEQRKKYEVMQVSVWTRLWWPVILASSILERRKQRKERTRAKPKNV